MLVRTRVLAAAIAVALASIGGAQTRVPVWIDTDPALGEPGRDVDDGFALVQAFRSPELEIRGISVVFGNAPLDRGVPIAQRLTKAFGPPGLRVVAGAASAESLGTETDASRALSAALRAAPMTILALGPATNVATVLRRQPELATRMLRIIAVAGRRPGQRFSIGTTNPRGFRDFNFELDPDAFRVLVESKVPLVLAPFEISSKIWVEASDLDRLAAGPAAARALAAPARDWLDMWRRRFAVNGFNPFDTLAVGFAASPAGFECESLPVEIHSLPDDLGEAAEPGAAVPQKPYLLVSTAFTSAPTRVLYCSTAPPDFKRELFERLMR